MAVAAENGVDATTAGAGVTDPATSVQATDAMQSATQGATTVSDGAAASVGTAPVDATTTADVGNALTGAPNGASDAVTSAPGLDTATAAAPEQIHNGVMHFMQIGGPVVWILSVFALVALVILLVKIWQFIRLRAESRGDVEAALQHWRKGDEAAALSALKTSRPASQLTALAMRGLHAKSDLGLLREELSRIANQKLEQMRAFLRPLELIASLSPLLGLLGTVLGMIGAFQSMQQAGSQVDPSVLSGGIWQALLTTAVGLAVAIPVVFCHAWLERKVERAAALMNDSVTRVFTTHPHVKLTSEPAEVLRDVA